MFGIKSGRQTIPRAQGSKIFAFVPLTSGWPRIHYRSAVFCFKFDYGRRAGKLGNSSPHAINPRRGLRDRVSRFENETKRSASRQPALYIISVCVCVCVGVVRLLRNVYGNNGRRRQSHPGVLLANLYETNSTLCAAVRGAQYTFS